MGRTGEDCEVLCGEVQLCELREQVGDVGARRRRVGCHVGGGRLVPVLSAGGERDERPFALITSLMCILSY